MLAFCGGGGGGGDLGLLALAGIGGDATLPVPSLEVAVGDTVYPSGAEYDAGLGQVNFDEKTAQVTVRNDGDGTLSVESLSLEGADAAEFSIETPSQTSLAAGQSATATLTFAPTSEGAKEAALIVSSSDEGIPSFELRLRGEGGPQQPRLQISVGAETYAQGSTYNFGNAVENDPSSAAPDTNEKTVSFTVKNTGAENMRFVNAGMLTVSGADIGLSSKPYTYTAPSDADLASGASRDFSIVFRPGLSGNSYTDASFSIAVENDDSSWSDSKTIQLNGNSVAEPAPQIRVVASSTDYSGGGALPGFGAVWPGQSSSGLTITIQNIGTDTLNLGGSAATKTSGNTGDFSLSSYTSASIAAGASASFTLRFDPTTGGGRSAVLRITSDGDDGRSSTIDLTASGTGKTGQDVRIAWTASKETAVNSSGGGYKVCYSQTSDFAVGGASCETMNYSGSALPTERVVSVNAPGTWYFKVVAFSAENTGGAVSAQSSVVVP